MILKYDVDAFYLSIVQLFTGLFVSGSIASVICINKPLILVLFHSLFLIILKFSIKLYSKNLEKLRC